MNGFIKKTYQLLCAFFLIFAFVFNSFANQNDELLDELEAFKRSVTQQDDEIIISVQIADGYYVYDNFNFSFNNDLDFKLVDVTKPEKNPHYVKGAEEFDSEFIFNYLFKIKIKIINIDEKSLFTLNFNGCARDRLCYPPQKMEFPVYPSSNQYGFQLTEPPENPKSFFSSIKQLLSEDYTLFNSKNIARDSHLSLFIFFILGLFLAFTPCMLPMYPILSGIVINNNDSNKATLITSALLFVLGMAIAYAGLGTLVAFLGIKYQAMFQSTFFLTLLTCLFVGLGLSMFGVYDVQLPATLRNFMNNKMNNLSKGRFAANFFIGMLTGLISSPCTTAPVAGALLYIAQYGDVLYGFTALFFLGLGVGLPVLIFALTGGYLLPKTGSWMEIFKNFFGFLLFGLAISVVARFAPDYITFILYSVLLVCFVAFFYKKRLLISDKNRNLFLFSLFLASTGLSYFLYQSNQHLFKDGFFQNNISENADLGIHGNLFVNVNTYADFQKILEQAAAAKRPVIVDFYTRWCTACKDLDANTLHNKDVLARLSELNFVLIKFDITDIYKSEDIKKNYNLKGVPYLIFIDADGKRIDKKGFYGSLDPERFLSILDDFYIK